MSTQMHDSKHIKATVIKNGKAVTTMNDKPLIVATGSTYTLDSLAEKLGPADPELVKRTFARITDEELVDEGIRIDTQNILADLPRFIGSMIEISARLTPAQAARVLLPDGFSPMLVAEGVILRDFKNEHDTNTAEDVSGKSDREDAARREVQSGIAERDLAYDGIRNALGNGVIAKLDKLVGTADTPENLARGLSGLATYLETMLASGDARTAADLESYRVGKARVAHLRKKALAVAEAGAVTATPRRRVSQRSLDLQDGRVLFLVGKAVRAFRAAQRADASILVPELNRLAWMFDTRKKSVDTGEAPTEIVRLYRRRWRFTAAAKSALIAVPAAYRLDGWAMRIKKPTGKTTVTKKLTEITDDGIAVTFTEGDIVLLSKTVNRKQVEVAASGENNSFSNVATFGEGVVELRFSKT